MYLKSPLLSLSITIHFITPVCFSHVSCRYRVNAEICQKPGDPSFYRLKLLSLPSLLQLPPPLDQRLAFILPCYNQLRFERLE
jgi:hypothetical protein